MIRGGALITGSGWLVVGPNRRVRMVGGQALITGSGWSVVGP